ncbi:MAG: sigma-54-dependent Fis family transcriptional regulator [Desulfuromonadales bacterium]|nr:sigma-54-dependent Fis family transcriptional regulator [Desulfuromonadales bacterium]
MIVAHPGRVLIVDDEINTLKACTTSLKMNGLRDIVTESDSRRVMDIMDGGGIDAVVLDLFMPHVSGMELLPKLREKFPQVPVIIVTAAYELERAVECVKMGAFDYLVKPVENERLTLTLLKALECRALTDQVSTLREYLVEDRLDHPDVFEDIVSCSRKMRVIFQYLEVIAKSPQPVLITGESGTGKELVTRAIHRLSGCKGELVSVNLAGLDDTMFSDTLFGHKKGAFTGADQLRDGLIVKAANGVILLDEIGDLGESSQIRLLRLIQEREFYPVGSDTPRKSETRIVCASNKDLKELVASGRFRNDLFYRLNIHHVELPPLRSRKEDIPLLLEYFIRQAAKTLAISPPSYPKELLDLLAVYHFPGNVRELQGIVFDAVARSKSGKLSQEPFRQVMSTVRLPAVRSQEPVSATPRIPGEDPRQDLLEEIFGHFPTLREAEDYLIEVAMKRAKGNQGTAAAMLGLKRQTFNIRLKKRSSPH